MSERLVLGCLTVISALTEPSKVHEDESEHVAVFKSNAPWSELEDIE